MNPRDAIQILSNVGARFQGTREDHASIQQAEMTLRAFIEQHAPLDPKGEASTPANENQEENAQKTPAEVVAVEPH